MVCRGLIFVVATTLLACFAQGKKVKVQLTHGKHKGNVVKGKRRGETEVADLDDVQKFFPKISTKEEGEGDTKDEGPDNFVDNIASGLGDFQAELLVAGQSASKVCARDVKRFCGSQQMKTKHPIHCLGLLPDSQRSQIHRLCKLHLQQSLSFVCATDLDVLNCDPVMGSKIDCLTEGIEQVSDDCADQVRLTAKVIAKVNNAEITVTNPDGSQKVHSGEYENEGWQCPANFMEHHTHGPCCFFAGDCPAEHGLTKFQCAERQCKAVGEWALKDEEGFELGGHLCCPRKKHGWLDVFTGSDADSDADAEAASGVYLSNSTCIFLLVTAIIVYWQRNRAQELLRIGKEQYLGDLDNVQLPFAQIELTTFVNNIFAGLKKEQDFVKAPSPTAKFDLRKNADGLSGTGYGGL